MCFTYFNDFNDFNSFNNTAKREKNCTYSCYSLVMSTTQFHVLNIFSKIGKLFQSGTKNWHFKHFWFVRFDRWQWTNNFSNINKLMIFENFDVYCDYKWVRLMVNAFNLKILKYHFSVCLVQYAVNYFRLSLKKKIFFKNAIKYHANAFIYLFIF